MDVSPAATLQWAIRVISALSGCRSTASIFEATIVSAPVAPDADKPMANKAVVNSFIAELPRCDTGRVTDYFGTNAAGFGADAAFVWAKYRRVLHERARHAMPAHPSSREILRIAAARFNDLRW